MSENGTRTKPRALSEAQLQSAVIALAQTLGWKVAHFRPAQAKNGRWLTPGQGDASGYPDLTMLRGSRIVVAELKTDRERSRVSEAQRAWLTAFQLAGAETFVWTPAAWRAGEVEEVLR